MNKTSTQPKSEAQMITFAYDKSINKIGCALLQPIYGGNISTFHLQLFGVDNWQLSPTKNMELYNVKDEEELQKVIEFTKLQQKLK